MRDRSWTIAFVALSPRQLLASLAVLAALLVPAAVAWACNPQPEIGTDDQSYRPGENMTLRGSWFQSEKTITVTSDYGFSGETTSTTAGTFQMGLSAPREPGSYVLMASDGRAPARTTFEVASPSSSQSPTSPNSSPEFSEPSIEQSPASAADRPEGTPSSEPQPAQPTRSSGDADEPTTVVVVPSRTAPALTTGGGSSPGFLGGGGSGGGSAGSDSGGGNSGDGGASAGSEDAVARVPGTRVFVDSLAPADRRAGGAGRATTTAAGRGPSERAATGDLWGGFRSGKAPSLLPGGVEDEGGPGASIGLALLGLGLVGLLSALAVAEVRRRRALAG